MLTSGYDSSVGVFEEGDHDLGKSRRNVSLYILTGEASTPDGKKWNKKIGIPLIFKKGTTIKFQTIRGTSFLCFYDFVI